MKAIHHRIRESETPQLPGRAGHGRVRARLCTHPFRLPAARGVGKAYLRAITLAWLGLAVCQSGLAASAAPGTLSAEELKRLPAYCQARLGSPASSSVYRFWQEQIGENFAELAYYCHGLAALSRQPAAKGTARAHHLKLAKTYFDDMAAAEKPGFTLRAELYLMRGEVSRLLGNTADAIRDFRTSIEADPNNAKAYVQLAEVHAAAKDKTRALETLAQGLRHVPDAKPLRRRYLELGGKEPFPQPVAETAAKAEGQAGEAAPVPKGAQPGSAPVRDARQIGAVEAQAAQPAPQPAMAAPIGSSKNPYCRFCPPE